jgi:hypothetical protein
MLKRLAVLFLCFSVLLYAQGNVFNKVSSSGGSAHTPEPANAVRGIITHRISGCDYFVVATKSGYDLLEWYGGHDPDKDDILIGKYESYGFHDIYDETTDNTIRVWTEDYQLSKQNVLEKLADSCQ